MSFISLYVFTAQVFYDSLHTHKQEQSTNLVCVNFENNI